MTNIAPYSDEEVPQVMEALAGSETFRGIYEYLFPGTSDEDFRQKLNSLHTVKDWQYKIIYHAIEEIFRRSTMEVHTTGLDLLEDGENHLFMSNHRDIVLDSAILNYQLAKAGLETSRIAIGDNLLVSPIVTHLAKLNKSFLVRRNVPPKEMYAYSQELSSYIRSSIVNDGESVWIAQREGRTKDGNDRTQQGLLKMLTISGDKDLIKNLSELRITPVAISYEYDPCDMLKVQERWAKQADHNYRKKPDDDLKSMITGINGMKGRVHLSVSSALDEELSLLESTKVKNTQLAMLAEMIDRRIHQTYHLWPINYVAYDMLMNDKRFKDTHYNTSEEQSARNYFHHKLEGMDHERAEMEKWLLEMYANPVINRYRVST
ncbi:1-acyl-sn-glycerol-3-phosphate acyltransferase [Roseivirga sp. BDSF3-8]|uniref:1-acyl-sn-glycerol-3-phosphate acyltransferase n=1 Tax=Roseivirga sp. BDSF3-8 TaxID=3241598 RepID=UPI003531FFDF